MDAEPRSWLYRQVTLAGSAELTHPRPWADVWRVPVHGGQVWFKQCSEVQSFEPCLTATLAERFPDLLPEVIAKDERRRRLLLADAGRAVRELGNRPGIWLDVLPLYAELQQRETAFVDAHLAAGVPDLRIEQLPGRIGELSCRSTRNDGT